MAAEARRGCGYRKVGGLYICGEYIEVPCDRLPYPIGACPVCGEGIHFTRGYRKINPLKLFGEHRPCSDVFPDCFMCEPKEDPAFLMTVGERYYPKPDDFVQEARSMGLSKRVPAIPKELELGKTVIYLTHPKAIEIKTSPLEQELDLLLQNGNNEQQRLIPEEKTTYKLGVFMVFIPERIEMPVWGSELTDEKKEELERRGITPISIPDGDSDHAPSKKGA